MPEIILETEPKLEKGSRPSSRLRRQGRIPAIVYGHGVEPASISVDARQLRTALSTKSGTNVLLSLNVGGKKHLAMAKELQHHPVRRTVSHVDFLIVNRNEQVHAEIPFNFTGEPAGLNRQGGVVEHQLFSLSIMTTPDQMPNSIEVDITDLQVGGFIRIADIKLPPGVTTEIDAETIVVLGQPPRVSEDASQEAPQESSEGSEQESKN